MWGFRAVLRFCLEPPSGLRPRSTSNSVILTTALAFLHPFSGNGGEGGSAAGPNATGGAGGDGGNGELARPVFWLVCRL